MARDICILMKIPDLRQQWINIIAQYIRENYGNPVQLDAIVGPDTKGFVFALAMAMELKLPYISAHELGDFPAESDDDVLQAAYTNARNTVNFLLEIRRCSDLFRSCNINKLLFVSMVLYHSKISAMGQIPALYFSYS